MEKTKKTKKRIDPALKQKRAKEAALRQRVDAKASIERKEKVGVELTNEAKVMVISGMYLVVWTIVMLIFTGYNLYRVNEAYKVAAIREAEIILERDANFRFWFGLMDSIYLDIPQSMHTSDLDGIRLEQITISDGTILEKGTPQLFAEVLNYSSKHSSVSVKMFSNDKNLVFHRPDVDQAQVLHEFDLQRSIFENNPIEANKIKPIYRFQTIDDVEYFSYNIPLYIQEFHKTDNRHGELYDAYALGDIYAAANVTFSMDKIQDSKISGYIGVLVGHIILWAIVFIILYAFTKKTLIYLRKAQEAEASIIDTKSSVDDDLRLCKEQLQDLNSIIQNNKEFKSEFLENISHEIRTPLNGILGMTELMLRTKLDDSQSSMLASLKSSGNNLLNIINDIWDFAKIEANQIELEQQSFPLRDTLFDVMKTLAPAAHQKNIEIIANISLQVPDILVGDSLRIRQVLYNLVDNAIKFTERGEITLSVQDVNIEKNKATLQFSVKDTGIGIPLDKQKQIFTAFELEDVSTTRKHSGIGLGLTIVRSLVGLMNGSVSIQSEPNHGSTFSFTLELPYLADNTSASFNISPERLKDIEVLIVDDNATNRKILTEQVRDWGMIPTECTNVDEAMRIVRLSIKSITPISLIISDLQMPDKDGIDLAQAIKADKMLMHIPVIILSSGTLPSKISSSLIFSYLSKPVRPSELLKVLIRAADSVDDDNTPHGLEFMAENEKKSHGKYSILLVEDLEINQIVTARMLETLGHETVIAKNGQQALEILAREKFDLVLMDIKMPVMDGLQALKIIREREGKVADRTHLPVVALTANAQKAEKEYYLSEGMDGYLLKPVTINELSKTIDFIANRFGFEDKISDEPKIIENNSELHDIASKIMPTVSIDSNKVNVSPNLSVTTALTSPTVSTAPTASAVQSASTATNTAHTASTASTASTSPTTPTASTVPTAQVESNTKPSISLNSPSPMTKSSTAPSIEIPLGNSSTMPSMDFASMSANKPPVARDKPLPTPVIASNIDLSNTKPSINISDVKPNTPPSIDPMPDKSQISPNLDSKPTKSNTTPSFEITPTVKPSIDFEKIMPKSTLDVNSSKTSTEAIKLSNPIPNMQPSLDLNITKPSLTLNNEKEIEKKEMESNIVETVNNQVLSDNIPKANGRPALAPLDPEQVTKSFAAFPDLALRSMAIFIKDAPKLLDDIRNAIGQKDNGALTSSAHAIKGLVSYYTKGDPYQSALTLETMGRENALPSQEDGANKQLLLLEESVDNLVSAMNVYIEG